MKRAGPLALAAPCMLAALCSLALDTACADLECGYGGPGCGVATLEGACGGVVVLGAATDVRIAFADDTGRHEATVSAIDASPAIDVTRLSMGRFRLVGLAAGSTTLVAHVDGWSSPQSFDLVVASIDGGAPDAAAADAGPSCSGVPGR